jgi:hypothetical protein
MAHDVFISFSSKDNVMARRVYDGLATRGVKCWISSKDISAGGNYQNEIVNALTASKVMVLVFSANANSSEEIQRELALAAQNRLAVMPLKIDDVVPTGGFIYNLATSQWVEIFLDFEKSLDDVATTIKAITEKRDQFALKVREAIEDDGVVGLTEQKYLEEVGIGMGLTVDQARRIIRDVTGTHPRSNIQECELKFQQVIAEVLEDGNISSIERKLLASRAQSLGISDSRAQTLLEQEKAKLGLFDASTLAATPSSGTGGAEKDMSAISYLAADVKTPSSKLDEDDLSEDEDIDAATDADVSDSVSSKDRSKYLFDGEKLGKGRLVLAVIKRHVEGHPNITYLDLEKAFPKNCQSLRPGGRVFSKFNELRDTKYFSSPGELVELQDCTIAVTTRWGIKNIGKFVEQAKSLGYKIELATD